MQGERSSSCIQQLEALGLHACIMMPRSMHAQLRMPCQVNHAGKCATAAHGEHSMHALPPAPCRFHLQMHAPICIPDATHIPAPCHRTHASHAHAPHLPTTLPLHFPDPPLHHTHAGAPSRPPSRSSASCRCCWSPATCCQAPSQPSSARCPPFWQPLQTPTCSAGLCLLACAPTHRPSIIWRTTQTCAVGDAKLEAALNCAHGMLDQAPLREGLAGRSC